MKSVAKAAARMQAPINPRPVKATKRRPNESENGPTNGANMAQEKNVAAANWPVTATEVSKSWAMSTNNGPNIKATVLFKNKAAAITVNDLAWFDVGEIVVCVLIGGLHVGDVVRGSGKPASVLPTNKYSISQQSVPRPDINDVADGLLLRVDIHTLYDARMIAVRTSDTTLITAGEPNLNIYSHLSGGGVFGLLVRRGKIVVQRDDWNIPIVMIRILLDGL